VDLLILPHSRAWEPRHGWAIASRIRQVSKEVLQGATRLALPRPGIAWNSREWNHRQVGVPSEHGRKAKYYSLTSIGKKKLEQEREQIGTGPLVGRSGVSAAGGRDVSVLKKLRPTCAARFFLRRARRKKILNAELAFHNGSGWPKEKFATGLEVAKRLGRLAAAREFWEISPPDPAKNTRANLGPSFEDTVAGCCDMAARVLKKNPVSQPGRP